MSIYKISMSWSCRRFEKIKNCRIEKEEEAAVEEKDGNGDY